MHRKCGLTPPHLRGLENEPLPRHGITHVRRGSPTPPERPTEGPHFGDRPSRGTPEDLRSCHGRGQETTAYNILVFRVPAQRVAMCGTRTRGFDYVPAANARGVFCWWL
jgi:hypothetical protein